MNIHDASQRRVFFLHKHKVLANFFGIITVMNFESGKFTSPQEELSYLREYISNREKEIEKAGGKIERTEHVRQTVKEYAEHTPEQVLAKGTLVPEKFRDEIVLQLSPETHDDKMAELISLVYEKGIANALDVVSRMGNPHIADDFHRFLVQYIKEGYEVTGLKEKTPLAKNLRRTLFEVTLSYDREDESDFKQFCVHMEQFYSGMMSVTDSDEDEYFTIEIANAIGSKEFIFYISVPEYKTDLLEKQLLSVFPNATLNEQTNDFNVFNERGFSTGVYITQKESPFNVIRDSEELSSDPMKVLLNVFSKLDADTEAAAIQMVFKPAGDFYLKHYKSGLKDLEKGEKSPKSLFVRNTFGSRFMHGLSKVTKTVSELTTSKKDGDKPDPKVDSRRVENVEAKIKSPIVSANFRIVVSAESESRAEAILKDLESSFNQFENTGGNKFKFVEMRQASINSFFKDFSFREFNQDYDVPLNLKEIATVMHFPAGDSFNSPEVKTNKMKTSSAPLAIAKQGVHLGTNRHRNLQTEIYFAPEDRLRHFYVIGQTGTGKTNILKQMIVQDILAGEGVCFIDPHGSDIQDILANIPASRYDDVIYFDPSSPDRPMALNMLEYDVKKPEQKTFVVNELFSIFQKLYGANPESMGPMFEQYFRNATMLVIEDPETGSTLLDVSRVMSDAAFRNLKLSRCKNPVVTTFWKEIATKAGGEASLANIVPYITSKFDVFLANDIMRPIIAQEKSSFNFREIMDNKKILLVNLSKGSLGDINSHLIGLILVGKILMSALARSDSMDKGFPPFYLYIDEFQNVTTDSISTILSEARKYKLSLNIAHQFIAQLDDKIKNSVFGNVGSMAVFRVGAEDAQYLETQYKPNFMAQDIMNITNFNAYVKMLSRGVPVEPFNILVPKAPEGNRAQIADLKQLSYLKFGRNRDEIQAEINKKYEKKPTPADDLAKKFGL